MHRYFIKTPWIVKKILPDYVWSLPSDEKVIYFTFDDGPHPTITPWVLDELKKFDAAASFFCIGNNVEKYPDIYQRILEEGHAVGNHTNSHLKGWKTKDETYIYDSLKAAERIKTNLFRPPYGRIKNKQAKQITQVLRSKIIMWDVLSADFDTGFSPEQCFANVKENATAGSIVVFHDSEKAFPNLKIILPELLQFFAEQGYWFRRIEIAGGL